MWPVFPLEWNITISWINKKKTVKYLDKMKPNAKDIEIKALAQPTTPITCSQPHVYSTILNFLASLCFFCFFNFWYNL